MTGREGLPVRGALHIYDINGNVMGENELDCSAILLGQESSIFWVVVKDMLEH